MRSWARTVPLALEFAFRPVGRRVLTAPASLYLNPEGSPVAGMTLTRTLLVDLDGTLLDTAPDMGAALSPPTLPALFCDTVGARTPRRMEVAENAAFS